MSCEIQIQIIGAVGAVVTALIAICANSSMSSSATKLLCSTALILGLIDVRLLIPILPCDYKPWCQCTPILSIDTIDGKQVCEKAIPCKPVSCQSCDKKDVLSVGYEVRVEGTAIARTHGYNCTCDVQSCDHLYLVVVNKNDQWYIQDGLGQCIIENFSFDAKAHLGESTTGLGEDYHVVLIATNKEYSVGHLLTAEEKHDSIIAESCKIKLQRATSIPMPLPMPSPSPLSCKPKATIDNVEVDNKVIKGIFLKEGIKDAPFQVHVNGKATVCDGMFLYLVVQDGSVEWIEPGLGSVATGPFSADGYLGQVAVVPAPPNNHYVLSAVVTDRKYSNYDQLDRDSVKADSHKVNLYRTH